MKNYLSRIAKKEVDEQLKHLKNEIDKMTLESIKNNNNPETILSQFKIISGNVEKIRKGIKPYTEGK